MQIASRDEWTEQLSRDVPAATKAEAEAAVDYYKDNPGILSGGYQFGMARAALKTRVEKRDG